MRVRTFHPHRPGGDPSGGAPLLDRVDRVDSTMTGPVQEVRRELDTETLDPPLAEIDDGRSGSASLTRR